MQYLYFRKFLGLGRFTQLSQFLYFTLKAKDVVSTFIYFSPRQTRPQKEKKKLYKAFKYLLYPGNSH